MDEERQDESECRKVSASSSVKKSGPTYLGTWRQEVTVDTVD